MYNIRQLHLITVSIVQWCWHVTGKINRNDMLYMFKVHYKNNLPNLKSSAKLQCLIIEKYTESTSTNPIWKNCTLEYGFTYICLPGKSNDSAYSWYLFNVVTVNEYKNMPPRHITEVS